RMKTMPLRWTTALVTCMLLPSLGCGSPPKASEAVTPVAAAAPATMPRPAAAAPTEMLSTMVGVYTTAQATRGKDVYAGTCMSCHSTGSQVGVPFNVRWRGKSLASLFTYVSTKMPDNDPGSLAPGDAADVVAYMLAINAIPPGAVELPADADSLAHFRIDNQRSNAPAGPPLQ
ncbi:MAG: cytochrome c, partial [Gemmatimonadaceae bacterium]